MTATDARHQPLSADAAAQLFEAARTHNVWTSRQISDELLRGRYERLRMAPTAFNSSPARFVFIRSAEGKEKLRPHLSPGNVDKTMAAPVNVIVAYDLRFFEVLGQLGAPAALAERMATAPPAVAQETAFRSGTLQGAYMILAARSLGLDCGPMSGFDAAGLNAAFFPDGRWKANFLCNLGYGDDSVAYERRPRLGFDEACELV